MSQGSWKKLNWRTLRLFCSKCSCSKSRRITSGKLAWLQQFFREAPRSNPALPISEWSHHKNDVANQIPFVNIVYNHERKTVVEDHSKNERNAVSDDTKQGRNYRPFDQFGKYRVGRTVKNKSIIIFKLMWLNLQQFHLKLQQMTMH